MQDNLNSGSKEEKFLGYKSIFFPCPFKHFTILWIIEYLNQNYNAPYIFEHCIKTLEIKAMKQTNNDSKQMNVYTKLAICTKNMIIQVPTRFLQSSKATKE